MRPADDRPHQDRALGPAGKAPTAATDLGERGKEVGEDHRDLDALERPTRLPGSLTAGPALRNGAHRRQDPESHDQGKMIMVDLAVAHADRRPPGEGGGDQITGSP